MGQFNLKATPHDFHYIVHLGGHQNFFLCFLSKSKKKKNLGSYVNTKGFTPQKGVLTLVYLYRAQFLEFLKKFYFKSFRILIRIAMSWGFLKFCPTAL